MQTPRKRGGVNRGGNRRILEETEVVLSSLQPSQTSSVFRAITSMKAAEREPIKNTQSKTYFESQLASTKKLETARRAATRQFAESYRGESQWLSKRLNDWTNRFRDADAPMKERLSRGMRAMPCWAPAPPSRQTRRYTIVRRRFPETKKYMQCQQAKDA